MIQTILEKLSGAQLFFLLITLLLAGYFMLKNLMVLIATVRIAKHTGKTPEEIEL